MIAGVCERSNGTVPGLGERWNDSQAGQGFPVQGANPTWHDVPSFLEVPLLRGVLDELLRQPGQQEPETGLTAVQTAHARQQRVLAELANRL